MRDQKLKKIGDFRRPRQNVGDQKSPKLPLDLTLILTLILTIILTLINTDINNNINTDINTDIKNDIKNDNDKYIFSSFSRACVGLPPINHMLLEHKIPSLMAQFSSTGSPVDSSTINQKQLPVQPVVQGNGQVNGHALNGFAH